MTMMTTPKIKIQSPTDWTAYDGKGEDPPSGVLLIVHAFPIKELQMGDIDIISTAYWSSRFKVFIGERGECLSESLDIDAYHIVYNPKGETVPIIDPRDHPELY